MTRSGEDDQIEKPPTTGAGQKQGDPVDRGHPSATELAAVNRSLCETNADLERRVHERTAELADAYALLRVKEQTLRLAQHFGGAGTWDWDMTSGSLTWWDCYGSADCLEQTPTPRTYTDWIATLYPEDRGPAEEALNACLEGQEDDFVF